MRAPLVFAYCHVTPGIGLDLDDQKHIISDYYRRCLKPAGYEWWGWYVDRGQSRWFRDRPSADKLLEHAWRGDVVVVAKADRLCHSVNDFLRTVYYFAESGKEFHIAAGDLDLSGLPVAELFTVFREFESTRISQQRQEVAWRAKVNGQPASGSPPIGLRWTGPKGRKKLVSDPTQREIMARIVEMRCSGRTFEEITFLLERDGVRHRRGRSKEPQPYSKDTVWRMYHQELLLRCLEREGCDFSDRSVVRVVLEYTSNPAKYRHARHELDLEAMADEG